MREPHSILRGSRITPMPAVTPRSGGRRPGARSPTCRPRRLLTSLIS